jgi:hypothetical protein
MLNSLFYASSHCSNSQQSERTSEELRHSKFREGEFMSSVSFLCFLFFALRRNIQIQHAQEQLTLTSQELETQKSKRMTARSEMIGLAQVEMRQ